MHSDALTIPLAMLIVFGSAKVFAELFERLRQPAIVGEIVAGVIVGPGALAWIAPNDVLSALETPVSRPALRILLHSRGN